MTPSRAAAINRSATVQFGGSRVDPLGRWQHVGRKAAGGTDDVHIGRARNRKQEQRARAEKLGTNVQDGADASRSGPLYAFVDALSYGRVFNALCCPAKRVGPIHIQVLVHQSHTKVDSRYWAMHGWHKRLRRERCMRG